MSTSPILRRRSGTTTSSCLWSASRASSTQRTKFAYKPASGKRGTFLFFYPAQSAAGHSRHATGLQHLAFMVPTRSSVRGVHDWAANHRSEVLIEPREFPQYPPPYFATFWLDPFGFMLEAVCHHDRD